MPLGLPYDILEQLYQPTEEEYDVETLSLNLMGWENEDGCKNSQVVCSATEIVPSKDSVGPQVSHPVTVTPAGLFGRRYRPNGHVMIENTDLAHTNPNIKMQPLRQAKISIGRSLWWRYTHTDDNGYFSSPKKYRGKVRIRAKWRSNIATMRKSWNEMLGIAVSDHLMTITRGSNGKTKNIGFGDDRLWYKGTVHNGLVKYNDYASSNGIGKLISGANVWVWKKGRPFGATPMFNHHRNLSSVAAIAGIGQSQVWNALVNTIASVFIRILPSRLHPDMIFSGLRDFNQASGFVSTAEIEQVVFHESGHYSHAQQAGSSHWAKLVAAEISNMINYNTQPYYDGSEPSLRAGQHISLAEGWATLVEFKVMLDLYGKVKIDNEWKNENDAVILLDEFNQYTVPMKQVQTDTHSWFMHGIFWDILDNRSDSVARFNDGVSGDPVVNKFGGYITDDVYLPNSNKLYPIFGLLKSDVYNACDFGAHLVSTHVTTGPAIEYLFHSYGHTCIDGGDGLDVPSVPINFYITNLGHGTNRLHWNAVSQASRYVIYSSSYSSFDSSYYGRVTAPKTSRIVYVTSHRFFQVQACNASGCSDFTTPRLAFGNEGPRPGGPLPDLP